MRSNPARDTFRGERFAALKDIFKLTQGELGNRLGVTQAFISRIMRLDLPVPETLVLDAAEVFELPLSFFTVEATPGESAIPTFRKNSRATMTSERCVIQLHREASRLWHILSSASEYRDSSAMMSVMEAAQEDLEQLATGLRYVVGVEPEKPIPNVTRFIEKLGVGVVSVLDPEYPIAADGYRHHTGISTPSSLNSRPLISTVGELPGGVQRMTLAHELGHLLLDRDRSARISSTRSVEERRAFDFAGALILPGMIMRDRVDNRTMLRDYAQLAAEFGVSVPAVVGRAKSLGLIEDSRYKSLHIQMNAVGWKKKDPVYVQPEKALLLKQAAHRVWPVSTLVRAPERAGVAASWIRGWLGQEQESEVPETPAEVISLDQWQSRSFSTK